jgi:predicted nucleotidyltransferase
MHPTQYPDLNTVLRQLLEGVRAILGDNFGGAYLVGSFALGEADEHSDVDFVVVTHEELDEGEVEGLRQLHRRLYGLDVAWAQHLEGSYIPRDVLRRVDPSHTRLLYLDNGANELVWDEHCNTAVVRWTLREHGVVLAGPQPTSLVEPVSPEQLRAEALAMLPLYVEWAPEPTKVGGMNRWKQPYLVLTCCRLLHSLETSRIATKGEAGEWAMATLDAKWAPLVQRALEDRPDPWRRVHQPADPDLAARTLAFVDYALERSERFKLGSRP